MEEKTYNEFDLSASIEARLIAVREKRSLSELKTHQLNIPVAQTVVRIHTNDKEDQITTLLTKAQNIAAITGGFEPAAILNEGDEVLKQTVLSRLSLTCETSKSSGTLLWTMTPPQRIPILRSILASGELAKMNSTTLPATDMFGTWLRNVLFAAPIDMNKLSRDELLALCKVLELLTDIPIPKPSLADVKALLNRKEFLSDYDILLKDGFFGRELELKQLEYLIQNNNQQKNAIVLTGLGGSGKSTLLAKFVKDVAQQQRATIAILDFDRPGIEMSDFGWMEMEIAKQVGYQLQQYAEQLKTLRAENRNLRANQLTEQYEKASEERSIRYIIKEIGTMLQQADVPRRPFLLVFDTCEEVAQQNLVPKLIDWTQEISSHLFPIPLKVIYSGRLYDRERSQFYNANVIEIDELDEPLAEQMLLKQGVLPVLAKRIVQSNLLPRRPLELKLLAKLLKDNNTAELEGIENDLRRKGKLSKQLFLGIVYHRVLNRIEDEHVQQLAYPGLVLRYLSRDVIREVLIPSLKLPYMEESEIDKVLNDLADFSWLAYRDADKVYHRKDLRRSMLRLMITQQPAKATAISKQAVKYFQKQSTKEAKAEALYHQLLLMKKPTSSVPFELSELEQAVDSIGFDTVDLPKPASVLMKFAKQRSVPVDEVKWLPDEFFISAYESTGRNLTNAGEYAAAYSLYERAQRISNNRKISYEELNNASTWVVETLLRTVNWRRLESEPITTRGLKWNGDTDYLANLINSANFTNAKRAQVFLIEELLQEYAKRKTFSTGSDHIVAEQRMMAQLGTFVLIYQHDVRLPKKFRENIRTVFQRVKQNEPQYSWRWEKNLTLLSMMQMANRESHIDVPYNMLKLDPHWLEEFAEHFRQHIVDDREAILKVIYTVSNTFGVGWVNARSFLGQVDATIKRRSGKGMRIRWHYTAKQNKLLLTWLKGPDPEFRDPVRYAIIESFTTRTSIKKLAKIIRGVTTMHNAELEPDAFATAIMENPEHTLVPYVELVDRCWALDEFIDALLKYKPKGKKLQLVRKSYDRWNKAYEKAIIKKYR
jgi:hypothetical protein